MSGFKSRSFTDLASGRPVVPGEKFNLSAEEQKDDHNQRLIDSGTIIPVGEPQKQRSQKTEKQEGGED